MTLRLAVLLLNLMVANTDSYNGTYNEDDDDISDIDVRFSLWPKYNGEAQPKILKQDFHSGNPEVFPGVETFRGHLTWVSIGVGAIVLLVIAYYLMIYRKTRNINDGKNPHGSIDQNQFRYALLKSKDKRGELSSMPLIIHSDENEDQAVEVFDAGQKRTSLPLSVNLEEHGEYIGSRSGLDNLLVDIEDKNSERLINT